MNTPITNRLDRIQQAHPWMLEKEARFILVALYAAISSMMRNQDDIQREMEEASEQICSSTREELTELLKQSGGLVC